MRPSYIALFAFGALALAGTTGCAFVNSTQNATQNVSGELWYVKERALFGLTFSSKVFHCPPAGTGPSTCKEATVMEGDSISAMASGAAKDSGDAANAASTSVPAAVAAPSAEPSAPPPEAPKVDAPEAPVKKKKKGK